MNKKVKIALIVVSCLLVVGIVYYFFFSKSAKADKPYNDNIPGEDYNKFYAALVHMIDSEPNVGKYHNRTAEELTRGYFKKNGYAMTENNVKNFTTEIKAYLADTTSLAHWQM